MEITIICIAGLFAAALSTLTGFGSAMIMIPTLTLFINIKDAIIISAFFHFLNNLSKYLALRKHLEIKFFLNYGLASFMAVGIGALIFKTINVAWLVKIFAVFLIAFSIYSFLKPKFKIPERNSFLIGGGILSGLMTGLLGLGGAIRSMFLINTSMTKRAFIATTACIAIVNDIVRISVYSASGALKKEYYLYIIPFIAVSFIGVYLGKKILIKIPEIWVKRIVFSALFFVGIKMFVL